jgi:hypothetical protein
MLMVFSGFGFGSSARAATQWLRPATTRISLDERAACQFIRASAQIEVSLSKNLGLAFSGPMAKWRALAPRLARFLGAAIL